MTRSVPWLKRPDISDPPFKLPQIMLWLPYPPSANNLWTRTKRGMRRTDEYEAWLTEAGYALNKQKPGKLDGQYELSIGAIRPDKRKRDLDNLIKPTSDALTKAGIVKDDSLCTYINARWIEKAGETGLYIAIEPTREAA